jgi:hypothetical protein
MRSVEIWSVRKKVRCCQTDSARRLVSNVSGQVTYHESKVQMLIASSEDGGSNIHKRVCSNQAIPNTCGLCSIRGLYELDRFVDQKRLTEVECNDSKSRKDNGKDVPAKSNERL